MDTLLPVACRFVPYDQWLITHVDPQWKVTNLKQWFLSKCFPTNIPLPLPPRYRPVSPITFASTRSLIERSPVDDRDLDLAKHLHEGDSDDSTEGVRYRSQHKKQKLSISSVESIPNARDYQASQYTLLTFSTGQVLEDDFKVLWYHLRPYELLELHHVGADLRLPRDVMLEYVQPCFEAKVRALRLVLRERRAGRESRELSSGKAASKGSFTGRGAKSRSDDGGKRLFIDLEREIEDYKEKDKDKKKRKLKLEWRERLLVIKNGVMTLCKDRNDVKRQNYSISLITALQGAERIKKVSSIALESPDYDRVVCCKFNTNLARQRKSSQGGSSPTSYSPVDDPLPAIGLDETESEAEDNQKCGHERPEQSTGEWIALDMLDDNAYSSILRILHRSSPQHLASGFALTHRLLPPAPASPSPSVSTSLSRNTTSELSIFAMAQRPSGSYEPSSPSSLRSAFASTPRVQPYPEWRMNVTNRAQLAGVGDIGGALKWVICGDESFLDDNPGRSGRPKSAGGQESASKPKAAAGLMEEPFEPDLSGDGADLDEIASDFGSEAEWEGWVGDLERQRMVAETVFRRRQDQQRNRDTSKREHTVQREQQALEPPSVVSSTSRGSSPLSSPSSSESPRPGQQRRPLTAPQRNSPSLAFDSSELATIKREGGVFIPRPSSPLALKDIYTSVGMATEHIHGNNSASTIDPQVPDGSQDVKPERRKRSSTITPAVGNVLRKGKNRSEEETLGHGDSVSTRNTSGARPKLALVPHPALDTDVGGESDRQNRTRSERALRHAWSSSSLRPGMRSLSLGTSPPRDETELSVQPDSPVGGGKRTKNGLALMRGVSARAEKLMKGLDSAMDFVDGK